MRPELTVRGTCGDCQKTFTYKMTTRRRRFCPECRASHQSASAAERRRKRSKTRNAGSDIQRVKKLIPYAGFDVEDGMTNRQAFYLGRKKHDANVSTDA